MATESGHHPDDTYHLSDLDALKALSHPLRVQILGMLRIEGPGTATSLAERLGESTGSTSYHLRQLARHGLVIQDHDRGRGRERWWKAAHRATHFSMADFLADPEARLAAGALRSQWMRTYGALVDGWLREETTWDPAWIDAATITDAWVRLTPQRLADLLAEITELIDRYDLGDQAGEDAELVAVLIQAFPSRGFRP